MHATTPTPRSSEPSTDPPRPEKTPPHCLYLPNGAEWKAVAETDCVIAACSAPGKGGHEARRIGPEGITLTERGKGTNTRNINNIAM